MKLESLYELIDELITMDMVEDAELGMRVREWYEVENGQIRTNSVEWDDLSEDGEWEDFLRNEQ